MSDHGLGFESDTLFFLVQVFILCHPVVVRGRQWKSLALLWPQLVVAVVLSLSLSPLSLTHTHTLSLTLSLSLSRSLSLSLAILIALNADRLIRAFLVPQEERDCSPLENIVQYFRS